MGLLGPVLKMVLAEDPGFKRNEDFLRDMFNIAVGIVWQIALVVLPLYIVIKEFQRAAITLAVVLERPRFSSSPGSTTWQSARSKLIWPLPVTSSCTRTGCICVRARLHRGPHRQVLVDGVGLQSCRNELGSSGL